MRCSSIMTHTCQFCGKHLNLCESDFFASIGHGGKIHYFFECPNCEEVDKISEASLPGYLKDRLVAEAKKKENGNKIYSYFFGIIIFIAVSVSLIVYLFGDFILEHYYLS